MKMQQRQQGSAVILRWEDAMRIKGLAPILTSLLLFSASTHAVETKSNFSGTWTLDKEKSQLGDKSGRGHRQGSGGRMGSLGMGIPG